VLVVSGQDDQLDMMARQLARPGHQVVPATRLDRALSRLEPDGNGFDLAVVDADSLFGSLPAEAVGRIAGMIGDRTYVVVLTSGLEADSLALWLEGRGTVLRKPLRDGELVGAAERAVRRPSGTPRRTA
jgi:DNA-binding response OmpR family regulator